MNEKSNIWDTLILQDETPEPRCPECDELMEPEKGVTIGAAQKLSERDWQLHCRTYYCIPCDIKTIYPWISSDKGIGCWLSARRREVMDNIGRLEEITIEIPK